MPEFIIPDLTCNHCANAITSAIKALDADAMVSVDIAAKKVSIETRQSREQLMLALHEAGYPVEQ